jgi:hypothetical protein
MDRLSFESVVGRLDGNIGGLCTLLAHRLLHGTASARQAGAHSPR